MPGKHVIEPGEHAGPNRSINRVFPPVRQAPQAGARVLSCDLHHLPHHRVLRLRFLDPAAQRLRVVVAVPCIPVSPRRGRGPAVLRGVPVPGLQRGHAAPAACPGPVADGADAHAEFPGGLLPPHAARHQPDRPWPSFPGG